MTGPKTRAAIDAEWAAIPRPPSARRHRRAEKPSCAAMPTCRRCRAASVTADGKVIAPDPATLPPDELDFQTLWRHPELLFAQTCWGPMELGLAEHVRVVGQPSYDGFEGGQGRNASIRSCAS